MNKEITKNEENKKENNILSKKIMLTEDKNKKQIKNKNEENKKGKS